MVMNKHGSVKLAKKGGELNSYFIISSLAIFHIPPLFFAFIFGGLVLYWAYILVGKRERGEIKISWL